MVRGGALVGGGGGRVLLGVRNRAFHILNTYLPQLDITILVYNKQRSLHIQTFQIYLYLYLYLYLHIYKNNIIYYKYFVLLIELILSVFLQIYIDLRYDDNLRSITHFLKQGSRDRYYIEKLMTLIILQFIEWFQLLPHSSSLR